MKVQVLSITTAQVLHINYDNHGDPNAEIRVEEGDHVLSLESCKCEIPIYANATGLIKFKVIPGMVVGEGQVLAEIWTADG